MTAWWKKALLFTIVWAVLVVGVGVALARNASSQYAADRISFWILPALAVGTVGAWGATFATRKRR